MTINCSVLHDIFGYHDDIYFLAEDILERMDGTSEEDLFEAMDEGMIYTADLWKMIEYYCTPQNADFESAWDDFESDLLRAIEKGAIEDEESFD